MPPEQELSGRRQHPDKRVCPFPELSMFKGKARHSHPNPRAAGLQRHQLAPPAGELFLISMMGPFAQNPPISVHPQDD